LPVIPEDENYDWFTDREKEIMETIIRFGNITEAAKSLGLAESTLYTVCRRVAVKLTKSRFTVNIGNNWKRQSRTLNRLLAVFHKVKVTTTYEVE